MTTVTHPSVYRINYCPGSECSPIDTKGNYQRCSYCKVWFSNSAAFPIVRQHELAFWPGEPVAVLLVGVVDKLGEIQSRISETEYSVRIYEYPFPLEIHNVNVLKPIEKKRNEFVDLTPNAPR